MNKKEKQIMDCALALYTKTASAFADAISDCAKMPGSSHMARQLAVSMLAHFVEAQIREEVKKQMPDLKEDAWIKMQEKIDGMARQMARHQRQNVLMLEVQERLARMKVSDDA